MHLTLNKNKYTSMHTAMFFAAILPALMCAFSLPNTALADTASALAPVPPPVQYTVTPDAPAAGDTVTILVEGVGSFIGESPITWTQNGKVIASGMGLRNFSFTVGGFGTQTTVGVVIQTKVHGTITKQWIFNPSLVNLVWEAHTTVPAFYDGKALASPGSSITVSAFPVVIVNGVRQSSKNLSFQWRLNGEPQVDQSGLGYNSFTFASTQIHRQEDVSVEVLLNDGNTKVANSDITVPLIEPELLLYQHDPLRGVIYSRTLGTGGSFQMQGTEMTIRAEPYFFSVSSAANGMLAYSWQLNGTDTSGPNSAQGELTLRQTGSGQGSAAVSVSLQNNDRSKILQGAQLNTQVSFGGTTKGGLFGI